MKSGDKKGVEDFFKQLPPSYLKYDYQGRVIRMDVSIGAVWVWFGLGEMLRLTVWVIA